jgi:hypothetical protein
MLTFNITKKQIALLKASDYSERSEKLQSHLLFCWLKQLKQQNDGHQVIPGRRILMYQNPLFDKIEILKQPVLNYLDAVLFHQNK